MNFFMNLQKLSLEEFDDFFEIMKMSFPSIERRTYEDQRSLLNDKHYEIIGLKDEDKNLIAFVALWNFGEFYFLEHFAVHEDFRKHGIGTNMLKKVKEYVGNKSIVLEVEVPEEEIAKRRIEFYKKCGFKLNTYDYMQPPLQKGYPLLPLMIMSYPQNLIESDFYKFRDIIYENVYNTNLLELQVI